MAVDYFVDAKSLIVPFQMNSSLLGSHTMFFGNILVSLQIIFYQVFIKFILKLFVYYKDFIQLLNITS